MFLTFLILFLNLLRNIVRFLPESDKCASLNLAVVEIYSLSDYTIIYCTNNTHCLYNLKHFSLKYFLCCVTVKQKN